MYHTRQGPIPHAPDCSVHHVQCNVTPNPKSQKQPAIGLNAMVSNGQQQQQQQQCDPTSGITTDKNQAGPSNSSSANKSGDGKWDHALVDEANQSSLTLESLTEEAKNSSGIPAVRFIEDIDSFSNSFTPRASAEILIGAYSDLFSRYKRIEDNLIQKRVRFQQKIPEIEKSLSLVRYLKTQKDEDAEVITRYSLAETVFAAAQVDCNGTVHLWLGANVMLEYTYDEAIELLSSKETIAKKEHQNILEDLAFTRNQIITSEVNISRIYNWDVRRKRACKTAL